MKRWHQAVGALSAVGFAGLWGQACGTAGPEDVGSAASELGSANLVISQIYGGGGNSGAQYRNDFIEIFNRGSSAVSVAGWSVQYTSAGGSSWSKTNLSGTIQPGQYYLVEEAQGSGGSTSLPPPDATGTISMSLSSGKVALVKNQTALTCGSSCLPNANIVDFVGFGSSATSYEGSGPTPTLSNTTSALRGAAGCTDNDNNAADFAAGVVNPRNASSATTSCGGGSTGTGGAGGNGGAGGSAGSGGSGGSGGTGGVTPPALPSPTLPAVSMSNLVFGAFGDVRPANPDDTQNFPDNIISAIFAGLQSKGVTFAVDAGDHCFQQTTSSGSYCHDQFLRFMNDKNANYSGRLIPTLGNHEACGQMAATTGNCTSWSSGLVHDFLVDVVQPTTGQSSSPYYSIVVYGSWGTAKFVHVAANAWTSGQNTWLTNTLNVATDYTFVLRHEPFSDPRAPGVNPSESLYSSHYGTGTLTLSIAGHTHLVQLPGGTLPYGDQYGATEPYEIILGNAGAPLDAGPYYGYAVLQRRVADGAIVVQAYKAIASDGHTSLNNAADTNYRFAVNASGSSNSNTSLP